MLPRSVRCTVDGRAPFLAPIRSIDASGLFIEAADQGLSYMDAVKLEFLDDGLSIDGRVVSIVPKKGVRVEILDVPKAVIDLLVAWSKIKLEEMSPEPPRPIGKVFRRPNLSGMRVLIVDDDKLVLTALRRVLISLGCQVEAVEDPPEALELMGKKAFDVVLLDWMLPKIPGQDMLAKMRDCRRDMPVAVVSGGLWWEGADDHVISLGANKVLHKPVQVDDIATWLGTVAKAS